MSRRTAGLVLLVAAVVVAVAVIALLRPERGPLVTAADSSAGVATRASTFEAHLFYPVAGGLLGEEVVQIAEPAAESNGAKAQGTERVMAVAQRYLDGPAGEGARLAFPEGSRVQAIDRAPGGVLFVSLSLPEGAVLQVGSRSELQMVYGLVNSLAFTFEDVERVALLWSGVQPTTFAGHVDMTHALAPSRKWVRGEPSS
jgi:hypothetical protein